MTEASAGASAGGSTGSAASGADNSSVSSESDSSQSNSVSERSADSTGNTSAESIANEPTTADNHESSPTTEDSLANSPTTADSISSSPSTEDALKSECSVPDLNAADASQQIDDFHMCNSGVNDQAAIDTAQSETERGGCAAISESQMLCNPAGDAIGEYTVGRPSGFPDYIGPNAPFSHEYTAEAHTPGNWPSLKEAVDERLAVNPTPGEDDRATVKGTLNDAGIVPFAQYQGDAVISSVSTDINGNQVVSNVTVPQAHILDPGIVSQAVTQDQDGTTIHVVGEGNGVLSVPVNPAAAVVFDLKVEADLRAAVFADTIR